MQKSPAHGSFPNPIPFHSNSILDLLLLARSLDDVGEIPDGYVEGEIQRREHDGEEDPPAGHRRDEREGAPRLVERASVSS